MAGRPTMDQRVTFQEETLTDDGRGGLTSGGWVDIADTPRMWASVLTQAGAEGEEGEARTANTYTITITIRNREGITEKMIAVWRGRSYNIRSVEPYNYRAATRQIIAEGGVTL